MREQVRPPEDYKFGSSDYPMSGRGVGKDRRDKFVPVDDLSEEDLHAAWKSDSRVELKEEDLEDGDVDIEGAQEAVGSVDDKVIDPEMEKAEQAPPEWQVRLARGEWDKGWRGVKEAPQEILPKEDRVKGATTEVKVMGPRVVCVDNTDEVKVMGPRVVCVDNTDDSEKLPQRISSHKAFLKESKGTGIFTREYNRRVSPRNRGRKPRNKK